MKETEGRGSDGLRPGSGRRVRNVPFPPISDRLESLTTEVREEPCLPSRLQIPNEYREHGNSRRSGVRGRDTSTDDDRVKGVR